MRSCLSCKHAKWDHVRVTPDLHGWHRNIFIGHDREIYFYADTGKCKSPVALQQNGFPPDPRKFYIEREFPANNCQYFDDGGHSMVLEDLNRELVERWDDPAYKQAVLQGKVLVKPPVGATQMKIKGKKGNDSKMGQKMPMHDDASMAEAIGGKGGKKKKRVK